MPKTNSKFQKTTRCIASYNHYQPCHLQLLQQSEDTADYSPFSQVYIPQKPTPTITIRSHKTLHPSSFKGDVDVCWFVRCEYGTSDVTIGILKSPKLRTTKKFMQVPWIANFEELVVKNFSTLCHFCHFGTGTRDN